MRAFHTILLVPALAASLAGQMSGTYTVDPTGTGARNFKTIGDATGALTSNGVSGPVVLALAATSFAESVLVQPVPGASATNTVTLRGPASGAAVILLGNPPGFNFGPVLGRYPSFIVFDSLVFRSADGQHRSGILSNQGTDLVVHDCTFLNASLRSLGDRCEIHHCTFAAEATPLSFAGAGGSVHHNEVRLTDARGTFGSFHTSPGGARSTVYDNVFSGALYESNGAGMTVSGHLDFVHNTVVQLAYTKTSPYPTIQVSTDVGALTRFSHNIVVNHNTGPVVHISGGTSGNNLDARGNVYWTTASTRYFTLGSASYSSLSTWQLATGQEQGSHFGDPLLVDVHSSPKGFDVATGSPAIGRATSTPGYVTDDFEGVPRPTPGTAGAFEGDRMSSFVPYGAGCPGTGSFVPSIGYAGTLRMGAKDFGVTVSRALGGRSVQTWFVVGAARTSFPMGGSCTLLVRPDLVILTGVSGTVPGNGFAKIQFDLPTDPRLRGAEAHFQWGVIDAGAVPGIAFSDAATLKL